MASHKVLENLKKLSEEVEKAPKNSLRNENKFLNMVRKNSVAKVSTVRTSTPLTKEPFQCRVNSSRPLPPKTPPVQSHDDSDSLPVTPVRASMNDSEPTSSLETSASLASDVCHDAPVTPSSSIPNSPKDIDKTQLHVSFLIILQYLSKYCSYKSF